MTGPGFPIGSVPRDGTEFLAYDPVAKKFDVCVWWSDPAILAGIHPTQSDGEYGPFEDDFLPERATLWWPLPAV